jgi:hypothetical protein
MRLIAALLLLLLESFMLSTNLMAADSRRRKRFLRRRRPSKNVWADYNHQASAKSLKSETRSIFMSTCLKKLA